MAKVYLESTDSRFVLNNNGTTLYGQNEYQAVAVSEGVYDFSIDQNVEEIIFPKNSQDYSYEQAGNMVKVSYGGRLMSSIPVQGDSDGTKLTFANGAADAKLTSGVMKVGGSEASSQGSISPLSVISTLTDTIAPTLSSSIPADNATNVSISSNIYLLMSENISAVAGKNITIKKTSDDSTVTTIDAADPQISVSTSMVTINPTADLVGGTEYYVLVDSGAFKDSSGNVYAGVSSSAALSFKTETDTTAPTISSSTPADNATAVAIGANIVLTMSETVTAVTGKNITIKKTSDNSTVTTIDAADAQVAVSDSAVTINPTSDLAAGTEYYMLIDSGAFKDSSGNVYTGISSTTALSFTTDNDVTAPTLSSSTPTDNATAVAVGANIVLTMSETVTAVTGKNITIKKTSDNSTVTTIDAADPQITVSGSTVTINPTSDLIAGTEYYVLVDSGALKDASNNDYVGISSTTALSFTVATDTTAPTLSSSTPADDATNVAVGANIVLTMSENVSAVTGKNITIKKTTGDVTVATIDAADAQVTVSGSTVTINPTADLVGGTEYYALIDSGAFKDSSNNDYAGISSTTALSFTTETDAIAPTLTSSTPADNATEVSMNANIVLTMSEAVTAVTGKNITIKKTAGDVTVATIDAADPQITVSGSTVTINLTADLAAGVEHYVLIDSGAFKDSSNNVYTGISSTTALSFTTLNPTVYLANIAIDSGGFALSGEAASDLSGRSVSSAGDVNGDGYADLIVGASNKQQGAALNAGKAYVIFGKTSATSENLSAAAAGVGGFAITPDTMTANGANLGLSVSSAGDINGDGLADVIVGAKGISGGVGKSYVVFGKTNSTAVDLGSLGTGGFVIDGEASSASGTSVSGAGDVNGDGLADIIVGASTITTNTGRSYVVFGKTNTTTVSLASLGTAGFSITGEATANYSGSSVSGAGDVNGDGLADLIVGAYGNTTNTGRSYVVFGKNDNVTVSLSSITSGGGLGFAISGEATTNYSGASISSAGDVNGDGLSDLIVGAYGNDTGGTDVGRSYVVFGKNDGTVVSLATIAAGTGGFAINGQATTLDFSGASVSSAGDFNGDGLADLIIGATQNDTGGANAGRSYVVYGKSSTTAVNLSDVSSGIGGFAINGEGANNQSGASVASAGDINGDGLTDLLVSSTLYNSSAGRTYVIFGGTKWLSAYINGSGAVTGTASDEAVVGSSSADTLTGGGGIDRFYAGDSNDVIVLTSSDIANLSSNTTGAPKAAVNGGGDTDTIRLTGGASLNLTSIANQGAGGVEENSRIESIEKIDMSTDTAANALTLTVKDVIDMSGMNQCNSGNGWTSGTYTVAASIAKHQLVVDGGATDSVTINGGNGVWVNAGTATNGTSTYNVYDNALANSQILVLSGVTVTNNDSM